MACIARSPSTSEFYLRFSSARCFWASRAKISQIRSNPCRLRLADLGHPLKMPRVPSQLRLIVFFAHAEPAAPAPLEGFPIGADFEPVRIRHLQAVLAFQNQIHREAVAVLALKLLAPLVRDQQLLIAVGHPAPGTLQRVGGAPGVAEPGGVAFPAQPDDEAGHNE